jgi:oligopeptide/dipeptide ABC transporter ATP-binding protein
MSNAIESNAIENESKNIEPLVQATDLKMYFNTHRGLLHAVDGIDFRINAGETLGLVGESGCGKSTVGNVVMRLLKRTAGEVRYRGKDIFEAFPDKRELSEKMQMIFQDPYSSLNPKKTIIKILSEAFEIHRFGSKEEIRKATRAVCDKVELPENLMNRYPHELDGGTRQVVGIARALSLNSDFIVCDEPVSSLDVSVQARIINLLMDLQKKSELSYLFISHDLSVVRHISNRIAIMYLGQIVETAATDDLFANATHPYSIALLSAIPRVNTEGKLSRIVLKGDVPSPIEPKPGCRFAPRCWMAREDCSSQNQELTETTPGHFVFCKYAAESRERAKRAATISLA